MRREECGGGHRLVRFREIARGVDRSDEDASDQGFTCLGLGVVESVGEAAMSLSKGPVSQVPMLISLRQVVRIVASGTDMTA
ncbi:hypothetical protein ACGFYM_33385 [Streptomyces sp. NPDC048231]|uniref:hypothetical protein n=1 Tax=Streptomyces sp. NPDC048231 TaxID=3365519 RepID=UPI003710E005